MFLDPAKTKMTTEGSYDGGCLLSRLEWSKAREALRCLSPRCIHREGGGEIRCSTASFKLFQTGLKQSEREKKRRESRAAFGSRKRERNLSGRMRKREELVVGKERENRS